MPLRRILVPLQSAASAETALATAFMTARLWNAHVESLHALVSSSEQPISPELYAQWAQRSGVEIGDPNPTKPTAKLTVEVGKEPDIVSFRARLADLVVVPDPASASRGRSSWDALHAVLFETAQPVMIAPKQIPKTLGTRICIGWNGTAESASAIYAALPWLKQAKALRVLWSNDYQRRGPVATDLLAYLQMHELDADQVMFQPIQNVVGAGLLRAALDFQCDLLVMGAYSHSRLRQLVLGGVTRHVLEQATIPLMMHR